jgi:hypothetical protein
MVGCTHPTKRPSHSNSVEECYPRLNHARDRAWFDRGLQLRVAELDACGVGMLSFASRRRALSRERKATLLLRQLMLPAKHFRTTRGVVPGDFRPEVRRNFTNEPNPGRKEYQVEMLLSLNLAPKRADGAGLDNVAEKRECSHVSEASFAIGLFASSAPGRWSCRRQEGWGRDRGGDSCKRAASTGAVLTHFDS